MRDILGAIRTLAWVALIGALYQELRKPAAERTWHGRVAGVIPYDFRLPTFERMRMAYWDPDSDTVFSDRVFGVGWAINIPVAARKLGETITQYAEASRGLRREIKEEIQRRAPQGARSGNGRGTSQPT